LSLCRRIARRHGGDVRFVDQKVGACVEVTLPHNKDIH
jgi:signal transduction histidine kinase